MSIDAIIEGVLAREGGYVNDPDDRGGETNWGITIATARAAGYAGAMRDLPRAAAAAIYRQRYVAAPGFDRIAEICAPVGEELVDTGVNMGPAVAARFLQRALNALNRRGMDFPDLAVDGAAGPATRKALSAFLHLRGQVVGTTVLMRLLEAQQAVRYLDIAEARPANENFMFGWISQRVGAIG
jgi:lysozyme family protein